MRKKKNKISLCTVSMNRLYHLQETLPSNIRDNADYDAVEYVILDYNSTDGLETYMKDNFSKLLSTGKLKYFKTMSPTFFHRSHSRNLVFKLASGNILCNVDADNFTGPGFASYVNAQFCENQNIFLTPLDVENTNNRQKDVLGRICLTKSDFYKLRGYDEHINSYGFEDFDLVYRLEMNGAVRRVIKNRVFLNAITHSTSERIVNEEFMRNFQLVFISQPNAMNTSVIILFKNFHWKEFQIRDANSHERFCSSVSIPRGTSPELRQFTNGKRWKSGIWQRMADGYLIQSKSAEYSLNLIKDTEYEARARKDSFSNFCRVLEITGIEGIFFHISLLLNSCLIVGNKKKEVNKIGFGQDMVFENFGINKLFQVT